MSENFFQGKSLLHIFGFHFPKQPNFLRLTNYLRMENEPRPWSLVVAWGPQINGNFYFAPGMPLADYTALSFFSQERSNYVVILPRDSFGRTWAVQSINSINSKTHGEVHLWRTNGVHRKKPEAAHEVFLRWRKEQPQMTSPNSHNPLPIPISHQKSKKRHKNKTKQVKKKRRRFSTLQLSNHPRPLMCRVWRLNPAPGRPLPSI